MSRPWLNRHLGVAFVMLCTFVLPWSKATTAAEDAQHKTVDGLAVYLGVVPAEIVKGHPTGHAETTMHGGAPKGRHEYHIVAAIFDAASGGRISDATVTAQVAGLGLSGTTKKLEPMEIEKTISYGGFVDLPGPDLYTIKLAIQRPGSRPVVLDFKYDHRRQ